MEQLAVANAFNVPVHNYAARLVYCDPPTNRGMNEGSHSDHLSADDYYNYSLQWMKEAVRCLASDSWLVICTWHKGRYIFEKLMHEFFSHVPYDHEVIWAYEFGLYTRKRFVPSHDNILFFKQGRPRFYWDKVAVESQRLRVGDSRADHRGRTPSSVWSIPRVPGNSKQRGYLKDIYRRSCQPTELCKRVALATTVASDLVLDLFAGTGSMGMACKITGRNYIGIDLCKHYVVEANNRLKQESARIFREEL